MFVRRHAPRTYLCQANRVGARGGTRDIGDLGEYARCDLVVTTCTYASPRSGTVRAGSLRISNGILFVPSLFVCVVGRAHAPFDSCVYDFCSKLVPRAEDELACWVSGRRAGRTRVIRFEIWARDVNASWEVRRGRHCCCAWARGSGLRRKSGALARMLTLSKTQTTGLVALAAP